MRRRSVSRAFPQRSRTTSSSSARVAMLSRLPIASPARQSPPAGSRSTEATAQRRVAVSVRQCGYVAFWSFATNLIPEGASGVEAVYVRDRRTGTTTRVSVASDGAPGDYESYAPRISADGRFVAFLSDATNLVPGDTNG